MLRYPDLNTPFKLYCDASEFSVGAVLCQDFEGKEYVVSCAERSQSKEERNADTAHKEFLVLVYAVLNFKIVNFKSCFVLCLLIENRYSKS